MNDPIQDLIDDGSIISMDDDGNVEFNWEVFSTLHPTLAAEVEADQLKEIQESLDSLVDMGLCDMSFTENDDGTLEPVYGLTDAGKAYVEKMVLGE